jgi:hypothetical protein
MVHKNGSMKSPHTTKQAALNAAYQHASKGDTLRIHKQNGQFQESRTVQAGSDGSDSDEQGVPMYGAGTFKTGVSDFF